MEVNEIYKVLIIDDEAIIRKGLKNIIDWEIYQCFICGEASNGIEGREKIKEYKQDIIIADIKMPGLNGIDMISEIK